jgi:RNAse (barnase) inhibitor barstar
MPLADNTSERRPPLAYIVESGSMTAFTPDESNAQRLDWAILRDGGVHLYWRPEILDEDRSWLESNGYRIVTFDCAEWDSALEMHRSLKEKLSFPDYYRSNLDALDECVCDDLVIPDEGRLVLVLNHYDQLVKSVDGGKSMSQGVANAVLDVFARAIRYQMLFGKRLIALVQSDDPLLEFAGLDAVRAAWNSREWLNKNRGL